MITGTLPGAGSQLDEQLNSKIKMVAPGWPALYQESLEGGLARCGLCPHRCILKPGQISRCLSRENRDGVLSVRNYARVTSIALDPIEKKPLSSFHPGKKILSVGTFGCNLSCDFCQNWSISQEEAPTREITPESLLLLAKDMIKNGNIGVAYTYNEPTIWYEYVHDCARLIRGAGLCNVLVTNGYIMEKPLQALLPFIDAMNIDLKSFTQDFYAVLCKGGLEPVLQTIRTCHGQCHVELTTLLIPGQNDSEEEIIRLSEWIASVSPDIPLHMTRHHPDYKMPEPSPISVQRLRWLASVASRSLKKVLVGNV
jgi:pyruvate formate lyase activating enzyme